MPVQKLEERIERLEAELVRLRREAAAAEPDTPGAANAFPLSARHSLLSVAERASQTGSWSWNLQTNAIEWSDEFHRILGVELGSVVPSADGFFGAIHDEDRQRVQTVAASSLEAGTPAEIDFRVVRPDGDVRDVSMQAALTFDQDGARQYLVGTVRDVTDTRRARELLATTVDTLNDAQRIARLGSYRIDLLHDERVEWSEGMFRLLRLPLETPPSRELFWSSVHPDDLSRMREFQAQSRGPKDPPPIELRLQSSPGLVRDVRLVQVSLRDDSGTVIGLKGIVQDITEHRALESQLRQSQKMDAVGRLAGGVAHDFNNYLTVLTGHAELLKEAVGHDESALESVLAIEDVASRCANLTQQLLTFSRRGRVQPCDIELTQLVIGMLPMLRSAVGETIELVVDFHDGPAVIFADASQVQQVILNLCVNARDAMPGGGRLRLSVDSVILDTPTSEGSGTGNVSMIQLSVADTGSGIAPEILSRIFEPFFTTKEVGKGTGLGLATSYVIAENVGGSINVESEPGQGTVFRVRFPRGAGAPIELPEPECRAEPHPEREILVVEDVPEVRELLRQRLTKAGYRVRVAEHGVAALERLAELRADVVVSDVVMPQMGGLKLARCIAERYPEAVCVLVTGYSSDVIDQKTPPTAIVNKPFSIRELVAAIERAATGNSDDRSSRPVAASSP